MISIFVIYSPDRRPQLRQMIECMEDMEGYESSQKIIVADNFCNVDVLGWESIVVHRKHDIFVWADMWEKGVEISTHDIILYLDSDRILPKNYLTLIEQRIDDDLFLFAGNLFSFRDHQKTENLKHYRDNFTPENIKEYYHKHKETLWYDPRFSLPCDGPGKGVMSGNTAFTKKTYYRSGGLDRSFVDHGAFSDTDFHRQCFEMGLKFIDLKVLELHLFHEKIFQNDILSRRNLEILSLNNYIRYCVKWKIDLDLAFRLAADLKLDNCFVERVIKKLDKGLGFEMA